MATKLVETTFYVRHKQNDTTYTYMVPATLKEVRYFTEIGGWVYRLLRALIDNTLLFLANEEKNFIPRTSFIERDMKQSSKKSQIDRLTPDTEVKTAEWYEQVKGTKGPTRRQRVKYAIIGPASEKRLPESDLDAVEDLMHRGTNLYGGLSKIAHAPQKDPSSDALLEAAEGVFQGVIEGILRLRTRYR